MLGSAMSLGEEEEGLEGATALLSKGGDESLFWELSLLAKQDDLPNRDLLVEYLAVYDTR